jgi:hypothetical protein
MHCQRNRTNRWHSHWRYDIDWLSGVWTTILFIHNGRVGAHEGELSLCV